MPPLPGLGLILAGAVAARTTLTAMTHLRAAGRQALRHAQTARLAGHPEPALGAVLMDHSQPAAYCVAGRYPTVIVTTGALQALDPAQLDAVLAHERAHLTGHHHRLMALARIGRLVLPFLPLMQDADAQVARLVEMHADDAATRARDPRSLASALVVLATAGNPATAGRGSAAERPPARVRSATAGQQPPMNNLPARPVFPGMCTVGQDGGRRPEDDMRNAPGGRLRRWRPRRRRSLGPTRRAPVTGTGGGQSAAAQAAAVPAEAFATATDECEGVFLAAVPAAPGETVAAAMQLAIGLLTAGLDSPELEAWAAEALTPHDADGLGNFMAGLHVVSELLLRELHEATGEPPAAILQRLAILAEHRRGMPSAG